jgi:hypothetical protein
MALTGVIGYGPDLTGMGGCIDTSIRLVRCNDYLLAGRVQIAPDQPFHAEACGNAVAWLKLLSRLVTTAERSPGRRQAFHQGVASSTASTLRAALIRLRAATEIAVKPRDVRRQSMPGAQQMQTHDVDSLERCDNIDLSDALRTGQSPSEPALANGFVDNPSSA